MKYDIERKEESQRIKDSLTRIIKNANKVDFESLPIVVTTLNDLDTFYNKNDQILRYAAKGGFGAVKGNIIYNKEPYNLLVLNNELISELKINDGELDGIISHELGHIFNPYPQKPVPTYLDVVDGKATKEDMETIKKENALLNEVYADYFSKITKSDKGLLSSFKKYMKHKNSSNLELIEKRIELLKSKNEYISDNKLKNKITVDNSGFKKWRFWGFISKLFGKYFLF